MKNKYVAIGLAILAIILVAYRLFFSGDANSKVRQVQTGPAIIHDPGMVVTDNITPVLVNSESIKIDPLMLLDNIDYRSQRYKLKELNDTGSNIFVDNGSTSGNGQGVQIMDEGDKIYKYSLFAVVIDQNRKVAVINDRICRVGDILPGGAAVRIIEKGRVELNIQDKKVILLINPGIDEIKQVQGGRL
jgi:hypothetical protein